MQPLRGWGFVWPIMTGGDAALTPGYLMMPCQGIFNDALNRLHCLFSQI